MQGGGVFIHWDYLDEKGRRAKSCYSGIVSGVEKKIDRFLFCFSYGPEISTPRRFIICRDFFPIFPSLAQPHQMAISTSSLEGGKLYRHLSFLIGRVGLICMYYSNLGFGGKEPKKGGHSTLFRGRQERAQISHFLPRPSACRNSAQSQLNTFLAARLSISSKWD